MLRVLLAVVSLLFSTLQANSETQSIYYDFDALSIALVSVRKELVEMKAFAEKNKRKDTAHLTLYVFMGAIVGAFAMKLVEKKRSRTPGKNSVEEEKKKPVKNESDQSYDMESLVCPIT